MEQHGGQTEKITDRPENIMTSLTTDYKIRAFSLTYKVFTKGSPLTF